MSVEIIYTIDFKEFWPAKIIIYYLFRCFEYFNLKPALPLTVINKQICGCV